MFLQSAQLHVNRQEHISISLKPVQIAQIRRRKFRLVIAKLGHIHTELQSKEVSQSRGSQPKVSFLLVTLKFHFFALVLY